MAIGTPAAPLVAGLAPTAAVTSPGNIITPDAVNSLVDSFHKGVITGDDLSQHSGMMAYLRNKQEGQQIRENTSQSAIDARESQRQALIAQNVLATHVASAQNPLVDAETNTALQDLQQKQGERMQQQAVNAWTQFGNLPVYKVDAEGNPTKEYDYDAMAEGGAPYVRAQNQLAFASQQLKGTWVDFLDPRTKQPRKVYVNASGEDVTPVPGNKIFEHYNQWRRDAWDTIHTAPKQPTPRVSGSVSHVAAPEDEPPAPMIGSGLSGSLVSPIPTATAVPAPQVSAGVPATGVTQPSVSGEETYLPMTGLAGGPANTVWDEGKIAEELGKSPIYTNWANTRTQIPNFVSAANAINAIPENKQAHENMNPLDIALAESLIKMYDPQGVIREFKWDKFQDNQPLLEKLKSAQQTILNTGQFAPSVRQDLIKLGKETIQAREGGVKPTLQLAVERAKSNPTTRLENVLDQQDLGVLSDKSSVDAVKPWVSARAASPSASAPQSGVVILKTGPYAGWKYDPRTGTVSQ